MHLESERLIVRDMLRSDLDQMQRWRPFSNPLSPTWNTHWHSSLDMDNWLGRYGQDRSRRVYAIALKDGTVIGRLSLRHIHSGQHAILGIALGADWVNQGYGTEALLAFMPCYFDTLGFQAMLLDVAAPNLRAIRCYEKVGFVKTGEQFRSIPAYEARAFIKSPGYQDQSHLLRQRFGQYQMLFYDMQLTREAWQRRKEDDELVLRQE